MPSSPLGSTHNRTTLGVACHHCPWTTNMVERRRAWHDITALGLHARSDDIWRGMISPPLDSTHGQTTSGVACHHRLWTAHMVERRRAWQDITTLGLHASSDDVGRGMTSPSLDSKHGWTASGVKCHHRLWEAHTIERRQAWHDVIALGRQTWSNDIGRGMTSPPLDCTHDRTTSGVACHHRL